MKFFQHRINSLESYQALNKDLICGIECDIRYYLSKPYLDHDLSQSIDSLELIDNLTQLYMNSHIILNFKETGGEISLLKQISKKISSCLILDIPFPVVMQAYQIGYGKSVMWRISEYEKPSVNLIKDLDGRWIWLDSFHGYWFDNGYLEQLKNNGFLICLVSNELQNRQFEVDLDIVMNAANNGLIDAICTKRPEKYSELLAV